MKKPLIVDPWAEYGKPVNFLSVVLEPDPVELAPKPRPTIEELERLLNSEEDVAIEILPYGFY